MDLMKDELCGIIMAVFIGLKSIMYAYKIYDEKNNQICVYLKAKGINKSSLNTVSFDLYYEAFFNKTETFVCQKTIKSQHHQVYSMSQK